MGIIRMIVVGLIVGILARYIYPGPVPMGLVFSAILGIAGAFVGGLIHRMVHPSTAGEPFHPAGFLMSIIGALILIFLAHLLHINM